MYDTKSTALWHFFSLNNPSVNITLDKHAPLRKIYVRTNQSPFMNKTLNKEIIRRSRLRNKFLNTKSDIDRKPKINNVNTLSVF